TLRLLDEWQLLAPFGTANPEPCFASHGVAVTRAGRLGKDMAHLKLDICGAGADIECVGWSFGDYAERIRPGSAIDTVCMPQIHEWNGRRRVRLTVKDLRTCPEITEEGSAS